MKIRVKEYALALHSLPQEWKEVDYAKVSKCWVEDKLVFAHSALEPIYFDKKEKKWVWITSLKGTFVDEQA